MQGNALELDSFAHGCERLPCSFFERRLTCPGEIVGSQRVHTTNVACPQMFRSCHPRALSGNVHARCRCPSQPDELSSQGALPRSPCKRLCSGAADCAWRPARPGPGGFTGCRRPRAGCPAAGYRGSISSWCTVRPRACPWPRGRRDLHGSRGGSTPDQSGPRCDPAHRRAARRVRARARPP